MELQRAAEIQAILEGISLPASRDELIAYARRYDADAGSQLARLPKRSYGFIDEVGEALVRTQPLSTGATTVPAPVSSFPPGGADYLNPHPEPGSVRLSAPADNPSEKTLEKQSETQRRQAAVQEGKPVPGAIRPKQGL